MRLVGGLGNQLFCLAAGRFLAEHYEHSVRFNTWHLTRVGSNHGISLDGRGFTDDFVSMAPRFGKFNKQFARAVPALDGTYRSPNPGWDANLSRLPKGKDVAGYFQSWRYASALTNRIDPLHVLPIAGPSPWFSNELQRAADSRPVVVHVRRGDYRSLADSFGLIGPDYLQSALRTVRDAGVENPVWVFSDEPESAKELVEHLKLKARVVEPPESADVGESLVLMTQGAAHVVSNSTFAWWGAFLAEGTGPVIAPEPWFRDLSEPQDLIPSSWLRISHSFK